MSEKGAKKNRENGGNGKKPTNKVIGQIQVTVYEKGVSLQGVPADPELAFEWAVMIMRGIYRAGLKQAMDGKLKETNIEPARIIVPDIFNRDRG